MSLLFVDYTPAQLRENKSRWYIEFYVKSPLTSKLKRKTIKVNRIDSITERRKLAKRLVLDINNKLQSGWNPFFEMEAGKSFHKLIDALNIFLSQKIKEFTSKDSIRTYKSHIDIFSNYVIDILKQKDITVISFDYVQAKNYLDYIYNIKSIKGQTFNNYRNKCLTIWNWFIENSYCKTNVFKTIKKKIVNKKIRIIIDTETRKQIKEYLLKQDEKQFLCICLLCFHGLIRPKEICYLKPANIHLDKKVVFLTPDITKDNDTRVVALTNELIKLLIEIDVKDIDNKLYIFSENFKPGKTLLNPRCISKRWDKLRTQLNLPKEMQFYSLKDSGIVQKLRDGISPELVQKQAGHSSLDQTNQYIQIALTDVSEQIEKKASDF